jgi:hypothetical protein
MQASAASMSNPSTLNQAPGGLTCRKIEFQQSKVNCYCAIVAINKSVFPNDRIKLSRTFDVRPIIVGRDSQAEQISGKSFSVA